MGPSSGLSIQSCHSSSHQTPPAMMMGTSPRPNSRICWLGLGDATTDAVGDQLFVAVAAGLAVVDLADDGAIRVVAVGIDGGEGADAAPGGPGAAGGTVGDGDALAALDERQDFGAAHAD